MTYLVLAGHNAEGRGGRVTSIDVTREEEGAMAGGAGS